MKKKLIFALMIFSALFLLFGCTQPAKKSLEKEISEKIDSMNYCDKNSGCTVKEFGCPFGCYSLVNKDENLEEVEALLAEYNGMGSACRYECAGIPGLFFCSEGKCIVPEEIPELAYCDEDKNCKVVFRGSTECCQSCEPIAINREKEKEYNSYYEEYIKGKDCGKTECTACPSITQYKAKCDQELNSCYYKG